MKILLINKFLYPKGGDAVSTLNTGRLLSATGHKIIFWGMGHPLNPKYPYSDYFVSYVDLNRPGNVKKQVKIALNILYSLEAKRKIEALIQKIKPDIAHLNNFAHQISPSILHVLSKYNIPMVMTMRDYKLTCPTYSMLLNGKPCEKCKNGKYFQCFINRCTEKSYSKSLLNTVEMYLHNRILHIYDLVDIFISPSRFLKDKIKNMGFKGKVVHLPNFVQLEEFNPRFDWQENSIVYFGRLSKEKGLFTLLEAMKGLDVKLKIIGEGPIKESLKFKVRSEKLNNIVFLDYKLREELKHEIKKSMFVVLPSECYENNPRSIIEGFALGKPAVGSRIGGIPELVKDSITGFTFEPGDVKDLRSKIEYMLVNKDKMIEISKKARRLVEEEYNAEKHYQRLMQIYEKAIGNCSYEF